MQVDDRIIEITRMLDADQAAAATSPQGISLISAGAGTGKTTTLTARISVLIARGIPASEIMAVTFTKKAAKELKERVEKNVGSAAAGLRIGTFHSLSSRILRKYAEITGLQNNNFLIVDEDDAKALMIEASVVEGAFGPFVPNSDATETEIKALKKDYDAGLRNFAERALRQVSLWKGWGLCDIAASDPNREIRSPEDEQMAVAYSSYQYELNKRNMVDFGDLILKVVTLFRTNPDILRTEASAIMHMLVDEAQDANQIQVEWVRLLTSYNGGLTAVGDEDQNIFGFQGGYTGAMNDMVGPTASRFVLKTNRRCTQEILAPANIIVDYNRRSTPKVLMSNRSGNAVRSTGHVTDLSEAAWIAGRIKELIDGGVEPHEIAVLFRSAYVIPPYEEAILRKGVPSVVMSGSSLLDREEVKDVISMVRMAVNPFDDLSFIRVASRPSRGLGTAAIEAISNIVFSRSIPFHEACIIASDINSGVGLRKDVREGAAALGHALAILADKGEWCHHTYDIITIGLEQTGYHAWVSAQPDGDKKLKNIEAVQRLADNYEDAILFLEELSLLTEVDRSMIDVMGKVRLSTMHSVKGLEFDHVFCPAFDFGVMPNGRAMEEGRRGKPGDLWNGPSGGGVEEERRLAHVAFTRARHGLDVSFAWRRGGSHQKTKIGGPSSFMEECEFKWQEIGVATTAEIGRKKASKRAGRSGFAR